MNFLSRAFTGLGCCVLVLGGLWSFFLSLSVLFQAAGFWGVVAGLLISPIAYFAAPLYAGFAFGNWSLLLISFGSVVIGYGLIMLGVIMSRDN